MITKKSYYIRPFFLLKVKADINYIRYEATIESGGIIRGHSPTSKFSVTCLLLSLKT